MPDYTVSADVDSMLRSANDAAIRSAIGVGTTDAPIFASIALTDGIISSDTSEIRLGSSDVAVPISQMLSVPSVVAGTTNTAGADFTIAGSQGTGTGAGGSIVFQVAPAGGSGTDQNSFVNSVFIEPFPSSAFGIAGARLRLGPEMFLAHDEDSSLLIRRINSGVFGVAMGSKGGGLPAALAVGSVMQIAFADIPAPDGDSTLDVALWRDASGILAQRNGTAKQTLRIYNTYTSASIYERAVMDWNGPTPGNLQIGTEFLGSGSGMAARPIDFVTGGVVRMSILASGGLDVSSDLRGGATIRCGAASGIGVEGRFFIKSPADGIGTLVDWAQSNFNRLQLGGTADTHPAIARDGAGIKITGAAAGSTSWIKVPPVAVSALPLAATAGVGARSFVNDALTPVFGSAVTGGGAVAVPVYSTGSAWNVG